MAKPIRFYLDEHIPVAIADGLRRRGIDVTRAQEVGLRQADDVSHLEYARREGMVLITQDSDFLKFHAQGIDHAGIIYFRQGTHSIGKVVAFLTLVHQILDAAEIHGKVQFL